MEISRGSVTATATIAIHYKMSLRTTVHCLLLLLVSSCSALRITRGEALRSFSIAAASSALTPFAAVADRGKDLYQKDGSILSGGGEMNTGFSNPEYDEEGKLIVGKGYEVESTTKKFEQGKASVEVIKNWVQSPDGAWADPVTGSTASALKMSAAPSEYGSITDAGKPERIQLVPALGLEKELVRADMVAAAVRTVEGVTYYDYDLALPAEKCDAELATVCLPSKVVLISAAVRAGTLHVLRIDASPDEWRRAGKSIKEVRSTFAIAAS